ncbi:hypothetical protein ACWCQ1_51620 [Streptomyces sp. NPDC002144]
MDVLELARRHPRGDERAHAAAQRRGGTASGARPARRTQLIITKGPGRALDTSWRRGLPNWFYREDPATNPDRGTAEHGERGAAATRLLIGADAAELREHIGAETFDRLPLAVVSGQPGVHAVTVRTAAGREVTLRKDPADLSRAEDHSGLAAISGSQRRSWTS